MNPKTKFASLLVCSLLLGTTDLRAETGDDNPTGPTGMFNGNITTGCSYDPYTRNAMRSVTDIVVAGAVGTRPLAFTRVANSRGSAGLHPFAYSGSWQHSYDWSMFDEPLFMPDPNALPTAYNVNFPDGRVIRFASAVGTPAGNAGDTKFRGFIGLSERFTPLTVAAGSAFLILTDGTQVKFQATVSASGSQWIRTYKAVQIIDPFGLITTLSYNADGTLYRVTEPGGRWLQLSYIDFQNGSSYDHVMSSVQASDGRQVQYAYKSASFSVGAPSYTYLDSVTYYSDPTISVSFYVYKAPNVPDFTGFYGGPPALAYCDDAMYHGPMKRIAYDYLHYNVDPYAVYGELLSEKHQIAADPVSTIVSGLDGVDYTRIETRGDGPSRTFKYRTFPYVGHLLFSYGGFIATDPATALGYDFSNYLSYFTDANGHVTSMIREPITGRITSLTHPPDVNGITSSVSYVYTDPLNPYYFANIKDELLHQTTYTRDSLHRITRIDYPDLGYETFTLYNSFNQAQNRRLTSGGTEISVYDTRGMKSTFTNADNKITHYTYDGLDRLSSILDPRGFTTNFEHNLRGELTKTTHPPDPVTGVRYFTTNAYNGYGALSTVTDQLGHATNYERDDYQRVTKVTDPLGHFTTNSYLPWGTTSSYLTTSNFVFSTTAPSLKKVYNYCDNEFRKNHVTQAPGTSDQADSYFTYDAAGNQLTAKNPRLNQTTFGYDQRNRLISVARPLSLTTTYDYDQASNKIKETRPDLKFRTWDTFDAMNRVKHTTGFLGDGTSYLYDFAGNMTQMTDSKGAIYGFGYDLMNRKNGATYPVTAGVARTEAWSYDEASNLSQYTNPSGQIQQFTYDNRNRQIESKWLSSGPDITAAYDAASRVTSIATADGTTVGYGYDIANRQISEDQSSTGQPSRHIDTPVDVDGNRGSLSLAGAYTLYYDYTQRQQLAHIRNSPTVGSGQWFGYTYDLDGNVTKRQDLVQGLDSTLFTYDALDRVTLCTQTGASDVAFAWSHYDYDLNNNVQDTWRQEQANKGERFGYDDANQLTSAVYNADNVTTPNPINYDRSVSYLVGALNRLSMNDNGAITNYGNNKMNQYTSVTGQTSTYDANFNQSGLNGWTYTYDAARRVTYASNSATGQSVQFFYDGLNRCVKRVTGAVIKQITYDGWKPIAEWGGNGALVAWNIYGPGPDEILMRYAPNLFPGVYLHYHCDQFGNVKFLLDTNNVLLEKYTYDAFGAPKITDASGNVLTDSAYKNRFMFTGREYLSTIGIYDYRNRMYSPLLGRFLQTDPLRFDAGDNNFYRYCGHNAVNFTDPMGLSGTIVINANPNPQGPGHAWITFISDNTGQGTTIGLWPSGVQQGTGQQAVYPYYGAVSRSTWIDDAGEAAMNDYLNGLHVWTGPFTNCADFAAGTWDAATGETLNARNWGFSYVRTLATSIESANGGANYGYLFSDEDLIFDWQSLGGLDAQLPITNEPIYEGTVVDSVPVDTWNIDPAGVGAITTSWSFGFHGGYNILP